MNPKLLLYQVLMLHLMVKWIRMIYHSKHWKDKSDKFKSSKRKWKIYENILQFVYVLVEQNAQDTEVLNRVKSKLYVYGTSGNSKLLHSIAILCAFTDDQAGWNEIVEHLGEHMHPGLGYTVYIKIKSLHSSEESSKWVHTLELSHRRGHIVATREIYKLKLSSHGFDGILILRLLYIWLGIRAFFIYVSNQENPRLPKLSS